MSDFEHRSRLLPPELTNDQALAMLLHLFICLFENEPLSMEALIGLVGAPRAVGQRWARYLISSDLVRSDDEDQEMTLTSQGLSLLREYLGPDSDAVRVLGLRVR